MDKKAISLIISFVLLIGIAVTIASLAIVWTKNLAQKQIESTTRFVETGLECDSIYFNIKSFGTLEGCSVTNGCFNVSNNGLKTINNLIIRYGKKDGTTENSQFNEEIKPNTTKTLNSAVSFYEIGEAEFIPVVISETRRIGCVGKKVLVKEEYLQ